MRIKLKIPKVARTPSGKRRCLHCGYPYPHKHGKIKRHIKDPYIREVEVERYICKNCQKAFRYYPLGIGRLHQSQYTVACAVLLYSLGLSLTGVSCALQLFEVSLGQVSVWRDLKRAGEKLRKR